MVPDYLSRLLKAMPFVPVRLFLSDGNRLDIFRPEQVMLTRTNLIISFPQAPSGSFQDGVVYVERSHVVRIEPLRDKTSRSSRSKSRVIPLSLKQDLPGETQKDQRE